MLPSRCNEITLLAHRSGAPRLAGSGTNRHQASHISHPCSSVAAYDAAAMHLTGCHCAAR